MGPRRSGGMSTRRSPTARALRSTPSRRHTDTVEQGRQLPMEPETVDLPRVTERGSLSRRRSEVIPERWPRRQLWLPTKRRNYIPPGRRPRPLSRRPGTPETTAAAEDWPQARVVGLVPGAPAMAGGSRRLSPALATPSFQSTTMTTRVADRASKGPVVPCPTLPPQLTLSDPLLRTGRRSGVAPYVAPEQCGHGPTEADFRIVERCRGRDLNPHGPRATRF